MTWFRVDDGFHKSRKRIRAGVSMEGFAAIGLWAVAGSWSSDEATGGFIPDDVIDEYLAPGFGAQLAKRLEAVGLWDRVPDGYQFHDWQGYNPSLEEAQAAAQKMAAGGAIGNHRRWHVQKGKVDPRCRYCQEIKTDRPSGTRSGGRSIGFGSGHGHPDTNPDTNPMPDSRKNGHGPDEAPQTSDQGNHRVPDRGAIGVPESGPNPPYPTRPDPSLSARAILADRCGLTERETKKLLQLLHDNHRVSNEDAFVRTLVSNGTIDSWITKTRTALEEDAPRHRLPTHDFDPDPAKGGVYCAHPRCGMPKPHGNHKVATTIGADA